MAKAAKTLDTIEAADRASWRAWLAGQHASSDGVWLIVHKKNHPTPCVSYVEAVEEALCFGWIDGRARSLDSTRY